MTAYIFDIETQSNYPAPDCFSPHNGKIICISLSNLSGEIAATYFGLDEKLILESFWNTINYSYKLIGFNCLCFDMQYILVRSIYNNVKIPDHFDKIRIIDVRSEIYKYDKFMKGKLSDFARALGIEVKTHNGEFMQECYTKKDWESIKAHCNEDAIITAKLFAKIKELGIINNNAA